MRMLFLIALLWASACVVFCFAWFFVVSRCRHKEQLAAERAEAVRFNT